MKIIGETARIEVVESDRYKCVSGIVWVDGRNINLEMVREGFARMRLDGLREPYRTPFMNAQREAQAAKRGIWSLPRLHEGPTERERHYFLDSDGKLSYEPPLPGRNCLSFSITGMPGVGTTKDEIFLGAWA
jgi:hypothetical protein